MWIDVYAKEYSKPDIFDIGYWLLATNISRLTIRAPGFGQTSKRLNWSDSDVTPMRRTLWLCPKCSELKPTRHENVVRHVNRKHGSVGEPVSVTTGQTRNQMLALGLLSPIRKSKILIRPQNPPI